MIEIQIACQNRSGRQSGKRQKVTKMWISGSRDMHQFLEILDLMSELSGLAKRACTGVASLWSALLMGVPLTFQSSIFKAAVWDCVSEETF